MYTVDKLEKCCAVEMVTSATCMENKSGIESSWARAQVGWYIEYQPGLVQIPFKMESFKLDMNLWQTKEPVCKGLLIFSRNTPYGQVPLQRYKVCFA